MNEQEVKEGRELREKFELAAFTGLLANPRYTKSTHGSTIQLCEDARRYAAEMVRLKKTPVPRN